MTRPARICAAGITALLAAGCASSGSMRLVLEGRGCPERAAAPADGAITWYGPVTSRDVKSNERWCGTVGSSVIDTVPRAVPPGPARADSLAIVSWNILIGGGDVPLFLREVLGYG